MKLDKKIFIELYAQLELLLISVYTLYNDGFHENDINKMAIIKPKIQQLEKIKTYYASKINVAIAKDYDLSNNEDKKAYEHILKYYSVTVKLYQDICIQVWNECDGKNIGSREDFFTVIRTADAYISLAELELQELCKPQHNKPTPDITIQEGQNQLTQFLSMQYCHIGNSFMLSVVDVPLILVMKLFHTIDVGYRIHILCEEDTPNSVQNCERVIKKLELLISKAKECSKGMEDFLDYCRETTVAGMQQRIQELLKELEEEALNINQANFTGECYSDNDLIGDDSEDYSDNDLILD